MKMVRNMVIINLDHEINCNTDLEKITIDIRI